MAVWAVGHIGELARCFVESTDPAEVLAQMGPGETLAPVEPLDKFKSVRIISPMKAEVFEPLPSEGEE